MECSAAVRWSAFIVEDPLDRVEIGREWRELEQAEP
jgi:hypothetical protein